MSRTERNVIRLHAAPDSALMERFGRLLVDGSLIGPHSALIPADCVPALRRELTASLRPAAPQDTAEIVGQIMGSFKPREALGSPPFFARGMAEELAEYPLDALHAALRRARRSFRALPSIAEMVELCEDEVRPRREQLRTLERMERERERRRRDAAGAAARIAAPPAPPEAAAHLQPDPEVPSPLDAYQLAVAALRRRGATGKAIADFTARLMADDPAVRAQAEAEQAALAEAGHAEAPTTAAD